MAMKAHCDVCDAEGAESSFRLMVKQQGIDRPSPESKPFAHVMGEVELKPLGRRIHSEQPMLCREHWQEYVVRCLTGDEGEIQDMLKVLKASQAVPFA